MRLMRGNCYVTCEALYHLLGGREFKWKPMRMRWEGDTHWFLMNTLTLQIVDPTWTQFKFPPNYSLAVGSGFLTKTPSKRALALMRTLLWQEGDPKWKSHRSMSGSSKS